MEHSSRVPTSVLEGVHDLRGRLADRFGERLWEVRLFGSQARGEAGPESDVDVLVVIAGLAGRERREVYELAEEVYFDGLQARSHQGTHDLFYMHFVRPHLLPAGLAKLFAGLQRYREQADYSRVFSFTEEEAREEVSNARTLCEAVRAHLVREGWLGPASE